MPKEAKELTALAIKNLKHSQKKQYPEKHAVGGVSGLLIQVTEKNSKSWLLRTTIAGKRRLIGLGPYPEISLKDAREYAAQQKQKIREGIDPVDERKKAKAALKAEKLRGTTFNTVLQEYLDNKLSDKGEKSQRQWRSTLNTYAVPVIGELLVDDIDVHHILRILEPIWNTKTETASRLRGRIEAVITYATVKGYRASNDNPARWAGHLKEILPMPSKIQNTKHMPAIAFKRIPQWFAYLQNRQGMSARALEFLALTAVRSGEVRGATWSEINTDEKLWVIPAERMKMRREFRIPLSPQALEILDKLPHFKDSEYIFPAPKGGMLSDMALSSVMRKMHIAQYDIDREGWVDSTTKRPAVPHGLRSSFRDWAGETTDYPREIIELCLAHDIAGGVERAYRRGDVLDKRRMLMDHWAMYLHGKT